MFDVDIDLSLVVLVCGRWLGLMGWDCGFEVDGCEEEEVPGRERLGFCAMGFGVK